VKNWWGGGLRTVTSLQPGGIGYGTLMPKKKNWKGEKLTCGKTRDKGEPAT